MALPSHRDDTSLKAKAWLSPAYDAATQKEVRRLIETSPDLLADAFFTDLAFGTGGMRGLMGVGTNRMNRYTIRRTTRGLATYLKTAADPRKGVLIGYDTRHHSREFAEEAARVLAAQEIPVFLFEGPRPTPLVSFGCRHLQCAAALMITASHNPKEYNGYKVYWSDGGQVVAPHDRGIMAAIEPLGWETEIPLASLSDPRISSVGKTVDAAYLKAIESLQHFPAENRQHGRDLKIVYTSLHGTGIALMPQALARWGFSSLTLVEAQVQPDGDFPTLTFPNPEHAEAYFLGKQSLEKAGADLLLVNDPDADRLGVAVRHSSAITTLTGNEIAALCLDFLGTVGQGGAAVTTIVSTPLLREVATAHHLSFFEVLTGFKYIGALMTSWEASSTPKFLFGAEESYGYLAGTYCRDKDGIAVGCLVAEMALHYRRQGKTLVDALDGLYAQFGVFAEAQVTHDLPPGHEGMITLQTVMSNLRKAPPTKLGGVAMTKVVDFEQPSLLPQANVLSFECADGSRLIVRPSGTEPKIKIYLFARAPVTLSVSEGKAVCARRLRALTEDLPSLGISRRD
jgi:phosphoglucomutase/phosphomannomutase